jgi:hypothetical protein
MDRRLSFLDDMPSARAAVLHRIAQEEEPVMKKKVSLGFVFAMVLVLLSVAALATTLLFSRRADAARVADQALEKEIGINSEMMTFFGRGEEELKDGTVLVKYTGVGSLEYVLGTYSVLVKDGKAEITWSHDGEDVSGGYEAEAWGVEQLRQMLVDCLDEKAKDAFMAKAESIAAKHGVVEDTSPSVAIDGYQEQLEARKTAALKARKLSESEMITIGRDFIISNYALNEEQVSRLELFTNFVPEFADENGVVTETEVNDNGWYDMINGKPCFQVEYLLGQPEVPEQVGVVVTPLPREEKDGYYIVYVNVETGEIEEYEYNSGLGGKG